MSLRHTIIIINSIIITLTIFTIRSSSSEIIILAKQTGMTWSWLTH